MVAKAFTKLSASISSIALLAAPAAHAQDTAQVEFRAGGIVASDPFLARSSDDGASVAAHVEVLPEMIWRDETTSLRLDGRLRYEEWFDGYDGDLSGEIGVGVRKKASETLDLFALGAFESIERSSPEVLIGSIQNVDDLPVIDAGLDTLDPTIGIGGIRRQSALATAGFRKDLSTVSELGVSLSTNINWFDESGVDYRSTELTANYAQTLAPNLALVLEVRGGKADFIDQSRGDGTFGSATAGVRTQVSPTGTLSASAGIALADVDTGLGSRQRGEFFIAAVDFCEDILQGKACLSAARQTRPTTIGGASTLTSVDFGWSRAYERGDRLSLNVRYTDTQAELAAFDLERVADTKFVGATAFYSYPINDRFGLYVSPSVLKLFDNVSDRDTNYQVMFGLSYTFGR